MRGARRGCLRLKVVISLMQFYVKLSYTVTSFISSNYKCYRETYKKNCSFHRLLVTWEKSSEHLWVASLWGAHINFDPHYYASFPNLPYLLHNSLYCGGLFSWHHHLWRHILTCFCLRLSFYSFLCAFFSKKMSFYFPFEGMS